MKTFKEFNLNLNEVKSEVTTHRAKNLEHVKQHHSDLIAKGYKYIGSHVDSDGYDDTYHHNYLSRDEERIKTISYSGHALKRKGPIEIEHSERPHTLATHLK